MQTEHAGLTDRGLCRTHNEDSWRALPECGLFLVCDGVGQRARGEIASDTAANAIADYIADQHSDALAELRARKIWREQDTHTLTSMVRNAIATASYFVHSMGQFEPGHRGMSTTASVVLLAGHHGVVGQVGDGRVYLSRSGDITQLTEDHTLAQGQLRAGYITPEEARTSGLRNMITRSVGRKSYVKVDVTPIRVQPGDQLLLCSDGLHRYLDRPQQLLDLFAQPVGEAANRAIAFANNRGGEDNITAVFVDFN
ncbi:MAG: PP2C family protein-serine/threonine phosphatase [Nannocystaceae bacterium]